MLGAVYWWMPKPHLQQQSASAPDSFAETAAQVQAEAASGAPASSDAPVAPAFETAPPADAFDWPDARQASATPSGDAQPGNPGAANAAPGTNASGEPVAANAPAQDEWYPEAVRLEKTGDWNAARTHAREWTAREPNRGHAWQFLARAERELGNTNDALRAFERAGELSPDDFWIAINTAALYTDTHDYVRAESKYRRALGIKPQHASSWHWLAQNLVMQNRDKEAMAAWEEAARVDPDNFERWDALCYYGQRYGDKARALQACDKAVAINPKDGYAKGLAEWARTH